MIFPELPELDAKFNRLPHEPKLAPYFIAAISQCARDFSNMKPRMEYTQFSGAIVDSVYDVAYHRFLKKGQQDAGQWNMTNSGKIFIPALEAGFFTPIKSERQYLKNMQRFSNLLRTPDVQDVVGMDALRDACTSLANLLLADYHESVYEYGLSPQVASRVYPFVREAWKDSQIMPIPKVVSSRVSMRTLLDKEVAA